MIIGASLGSFNNFNLKQSIDLYSKLSNDLGLDSVEIRFEKERDRPSLWPWEANGALINFLDNFKMKGAHLQFIDLNLISFNPKIKQESVSQIKYAIKKASELGMSYVVLHAKGFDYGLTYEQQLNEWIKIIRELTLCAEDNSIVLTIENADFFKKLKDISIVVRKINSTWLKMTLDIGHAHIRNVPPLTTFPIKEIFSKALDMTPLPFISEKYMPYANYGSMEKFIELENDIIFNLHIHDNNGKKDHLEIGKGKIDFSFLSTLKKNMVEKVITFEINFNQRTFDECYNSFRMNYEYMHNIMNRL